MNLRQVKYFVAVAEELHFGRAALRLHISQPPLSMNIRQLEDSLGVELLSRTNKSVRLTSAGAAFYEESLRLLRQADEMQRVAERVAKGQTGSLRVGFTSSMLFRGLEDIVDHYRRRYPGVAISLKEMNSSEQLNALIREQIDAGFVHNYQANDDISARLFLAERFICSLPSRHPLAATPIVPVQKLRYEPFLLFPHALSPHYHDQIVAICVNAGFSPEVLYEVRSWLTIVELVSQSMGIALVPASMQKIRNPGIVFRPIDDSSILSETHCVWRKGTMPATITHFVEESFRRGAPG